VLLGGEAFVEQMTPRLEESSSVAEIPKRQRRLHRPALKTL
jgi:putative transposase